MNQDGPPEASGPSLVSSDERWDRLAAGTLTEAEEAELRILAMRSEEARRAYEAFRPFGDEFKEEVFERLRRDRSPSVEGGFPPDAPAGSIKTSSRPRRWLPMAAAILVALLGAWLLYPPSQPLPGYELSYTGGLQTLRGPASTNASVLVSPETDLEIVFRPETDVEGEITVQAGLEKDGETQTWPGQLQIASSGAIRLSAAAGQRLDLEPGDWVLWIVVARPGVLSDLTRAVSLDEARALDDGQWGTLQLRFER